MPIQIELEVFDHCPTIIVSPQGELPIKECLYQYNKLAHIVIQDKPLGMGNAVLKFNESPANDLTKDLILIWGDIPFISRKTLFSLVSAHISNENIFTFASRNVDSAYTIVNRDNRGKVVSVLETREEKLPGRPGERDIGLFVFNKNIILKLLMEDLPGKWGSLTSEHGFLYLIKHLASRGYRVEALPIASKKELISLNKISDLKS